MSFVVFLVSFLQNVRLAKIALRPGAGDLVNGILRKLVTLKVFLFSLTFSLSLGSRAYNTKRKSL